MPTIRVKDIRDMSSKERQAKVRELRIELARLKTMVKAGGSVDNPSRMAELRKAIARLLTIEGEEAQREEKG